MPLPLLWILGTVGTVVAGYAAKKMTEDDESSYRPDDYSSYEEERRRQEKAEKEAKKAEKKRKKKLLRTDFANTGEKYRHDIAAALNNLVSLRFEKNPGFCRTLGSRFKASPEQELSQANTIFNTIFSDHEHRLATISSEQQISWANNYCTTKIKTSLSFLAENYAVEISPAAQFKEYSTIIDESMYSIEELNNVKQALEKLKRQLKNVSN